MRRKLNRILIMITGIFIFCMPVLKIHAEEEVFYYSEETKKDYNNEEVMMIAKDADFSSWYTTDSYPLIKEIRFEEGVETLGRFVFYYFPNVEKIVFPVTVEDVGEAFHPYSITEGIASEDYCLRKLTDIEVEKENPNFTVMEGGLYTKDQTVLIFYPSARQNTKYQMPEYVTSISDYAFGYNTNLTEITFGLYFGGISNIPDYGELPNLMRFSVAANNRYITAVDGVLLSADKTCLIAYPNGRTVKRYVVPKTVRETYNSCFGTAKIDEVVLPSDIGNEIFFWRYDGNQIGAFTIVDGTNYSTVDGVLYNKEMTVMASWPGRKQATELKFPSTLESLYLYEKFIPCLSQVTKITVPKGVNQIDIDGVMSSLECITVEKGNKSFAVVDGLLYSKDKRRLLLVPAKAEKETITIPKECTLAFGCSGTMPYVKKVVLNGPGMFDLYKLFPNLTAFELGKGNQEAKVIDGVLYSADGKTLIAYPQAKERESFIVPSAVTSIDRGQGWDNLSSARNNLQTVTLSKEMKLMDIWDAEWLANCTSLKEIRVEEGNPYITAVDGVLYTKDMSKMICYPPAKTDTDYEVPDSVKVIQIGMGNPYLTTIHLGAGFQVFDFLDNDSKDILSEFSSLEQVTVSKKNKMWVAENGVLYEKYNGKRILRIYPMGKKDISFIIPADVSFIDYHVTFNQNPYLNVLESESVQVKVFGKDTID